MPSLANTLKTCFIHDMFTFLMIILNPILLTHATASSLAPDFIVQQNLSSGGISLKATPPTGHHFNIQAPAQLVLNSKTSENIAPKALKPTTLKENQSFFNVSTSDLSPDRNAYSLTLYLCDDKKSFCEKHVVSGLFHSIPKGMINQPSLHQPSPTDAKKAFRQIPGPAKPLPPNEFEFIINDPDLAFTRAAKENKPLFIDFFGIWCPPCNLLDQEVFNSAAFHQAASSFILLKLDADLDLSWKYKSKYKITGYPTLLLTNAQGDEIQRLVGYRPKKAVIQALHEAWSQRNNPPQQLKLKAESGDRGANLRLGQILLDQQDFEGAIQCFNRAGAQIKSLEAKIKLLEKKESKSELIPTLEQIIALAPESPESLEYRQKLASLYEESKNTVAQTALLKEILSRGEALYQTLPPDSSEPSRTDVLEIMALSQESLGALSPESYSSLAAQTLWRRAANEIKKSLRSTADRANQLEYSYALWKAGDFSTAESIYRLMQKHFPKEFTFYYAHASMAFSQKDYTKTLQLVDTALKYSYGDNRLRCAILKVKTLKSIGKKDQVNPFIQDILAPVKIPEDSSLRTRKYLDTLDKMREST